VLLLIDLDNTLVDRAAAFASWARSFAGEHSGQGSDEAIADWIIRADRNGYTPRPQLAGAISERLGLPGSQAAIDALVDRLVYEHVELVEPYPGIRDQLARLVDDGHRFVIVSNGPTRQQSLKLRRTGVDHAAAGVVISEQFGVKKPDLRIFAEGLRLGGAAGSDAWMVGDDVTADMVGGRAAGLRTAWVEHGRPWPEPWQPTVRAPDVTAALQAIVRLDDAAG